MGNKFASSILKSAFRVRQWNCLSGSYIIVDVDIDSIPEGVSETSSGGLVIVGAEADVELITGTAFSSAFGKG